LLLVSFTSFAEVTKKPTTIMLWVFAKAAIQTPEAADYVTYPFGSSAC